MTGSLPPSLWSMLPGARQTKADRARAVTTVARLSLGLLRAFQTEHAPKLPVAMREPLDAAVKALTTLVKAGTPRRAKRSS